MTRIDNLVLSAYPQITHEVTKHSRFSLLHCIFFLPGLQKPSLYPISFEQPTRWIQIIQLAEVGGEVNKRSRVTLYFNTGHSALFMPVSSLWPFLLKIWWYASAWWLPLFLLLHFFSRNNLGAYNFFNNKKSEQPEFPHPDLTPTWLFLWHTLWYTYICTLLLHPRILNFLLHLLGFRSYSLLNSHSIYSFLFP